MGSKRTERPGYLKRKDIDLLDVPWKISKKDSRAKGDLDKIIHPETPEGEVSQDKRFLFRDIGRNRESEWWETCRAFEANPEFYNAYLYLSQHPVFWWFPTPARGKPGREVFHERNLIDDRGMFEGMEFTVHRVDPETGSVSEDPMRNTRVEIWYEVCMTRLPPQDTSIRVHVWQMDGGAPTYEEAVIKAAKQIHKKYGNDRRVLDKED